MDNEKKALELMLSGYFHDLGKAYRKVNINSKYNKTPHEVISAEKIEPLKNCFSEWVRDYERVILLVKNHHALREHSVEDLKKYMSEEDILMLKLLIIADRLDSTNRNLVDESLIKQQKGSDKTILNPLFMLYDTKGEGIDNKDILNKWRFYHWVKITQLIFHKERNGYLNYMKNKGGIVSDSHMMEKLIEDIKYYLSNIKDVKYSMEILDNILFDYLFFISSSDYSSSENKTTIPDLSLYYHLKIVSLIAYSLYWMYINNRDFRNDLEKARSIDNIVKIINTEYNPVGELYIDISGIQKFITNIQNLEDLVGSAKLLRGRSVYLELLQKLISKAICDVLDIPYNFILKDNGGFIHILIPNYRKGDSGRTKELIDKVMNSINLYLYRVFKGNIYAYYEYNSNVKTTLNDLDDLIGIYLKSDLKDKKFNNEALKNIIGMFDIDKSEIINKSEMCRFCGLEKAHNDGLCRMCDRIKREFGDKIVKEDYVLIHKINNIPDRYKDAEFDLFIEVENKRIAYKIEIKDNVPSSYRENVYLYRVLPNYSFLEDEQHTREYDEDKIYPFILSGLYVPYKKDANKDTIHVKSFNDIVSFNDYLAKEGILKLKKNELAIIKIDVNNLGMLIPRMVKSYGGLYESIEGDKERYSGITLSRKYQLIKFIELFFTLGIQQIIQEKNTVSKDDNIFYKNGLRFKDTTYVLYAGGDDLVLITTNYNALKLLNKIHEHFLEFQFIRYVKYPVITIKGAVRYFKPKYPLYLVYKELAELLELVEKDRYIKHTTEKLNDENYVGLNKNVVIYNYPLEMFIHSWEEIKEIAKIHEKIYESKNISEALKDFFQLNEIDTNYNINLFSSSALYQFNQIHHGYYSYMKMKMSDTPEKTLIASIRIYPVPHVYVRYLLTTKLKSKLDKEDIEKISQKVCEYISGSQYLNYATLFEEVCMYDERK